MKKLLGMVALLAVGFVGGAYAQKAAAAKKEITQQKPADMTWKAVAPNMPVEAAESWKSAGGAHCSFNKFPKGFAAPTHTHSNDVYSIVVAGKWGSNVEGSPQALQGPGGYQMIPSGLKHETHCGADADCVIYECGPKAFDLKGLPPPPKK